MCISLKTCICRMRFPDASVCLCKSKDVGTLQRCLDYLSWLNPSNSNLASISCAKHFSNLVTSRWRMCYNKINHFKTGRFWSDFLRCKEHHAWTMPSLHCRTAGGTTGGWKPLNTSCKVWFMIWEVQYQFWQLLFRNVPLMHVTLIDIDITLLMIPWLSL